MQLDVDDCTRLGIVVSLVLLALVITALLTLALFVYSAPVYELESQLVRGMK